MVIEAHDLGKRYGKRDAVHRLGFAIPRGEIVGFLGPNGAGKTTTLRMLAGLIRPTTGHARILGGSVPGPTLRRVGTMIEEPSFYPYMTGRDALRYAAILHGGVSDDRVDETLAFVKLTAAGGKKVKAYSQGMRQRLGLARALLHRPDVLLLDEPTNGLDPVGIAEIRENLRTVAATGVTILVSSHILAEIEKLVDRVIAVERGRLLFDGPLRALLAQLEGRTDRVALRATDEAALVTTLTTLGVPIVDRPADHAATVPDGSRQGSGHDRGPARWVHVTTGDVPGLVRDLVHADVQIEEVRREGTDLESAYLGLLRDEAGGPS